MHHRWLVLLALVGCERAEPLQPWPIVNGLAARGSIAARESHVCARGSAGRAWCWGNNSEGQLGVDGVDGRRPVAVPGVSAVAGVASGGSASCAWTTAGDIWCWGAGSSTPQNRMAPHRLVALDHVVEVALDMDRGCARHGDGRVTCFSPERWDPQIVEIPFVRSAVELAVGENHACARLADGEVTCWRLATDPQPLAFTAATHATSITASNIHGTGDAFSALLGAGTIVTLDLPSMITSVRRVPEDTMRISASGYSLCALGHAVTCWFEDEPGVSVPQTTGATDVVVGVGIACVRTREGHPACWGRADEVGDGGDTESSVPVEVPGITDAIQLATNGYRMCVRRATGGVVCWGSTLGDGNRIDPTPVEAPATAARDLAVGQNLACTRDVRGTVSCWGDSSRPTAFPKLANTTSLVVYSYATACGLHGTAVTCAGKGGDELAALSPNATRLSTYKKVFCVEHAGATACGRPILFEIEMALCGRSSIQCPHGRLGIELGMGVVAEGFGMSRTCVIRGSNVECRGEHAEVWTPVPGLEDPIAITGDAQCVLLRSGHVRCIDDDLITTTEMPGIGDALELVGDGFGCVRRKSGHVACWGNNDLLGNGSRFEHDTAAALPLPL